MLFRVIKILFHSSVFKEMLSFTILVSMDMALQVKRISIALEGSYFDMYTRSKGILSEISFSYLDLKCMSQLFMTILMYDLILTSCILKKARLKHSNERANLFHHHSLWDKGTHGFLWLLKNIWPTIPDRKPGVPDYHYSWEGWTFLSDLLLFLFLVLQGRTLKTEIAETRKYIFVRSYLESNNPLRQG